MSFKDINEIIEFDSDVNIKGSFVYFWTADYMKTIYNLINQAKVSLIEKTILDIGIGRGRALPLYKILGVKKVIGIDVVRSETQIALSHAKKLHIPLQIIIDDNNNHQLQQIPNESFDVIILMNSLQMATQEAQLVITREIQRILKPKGGLIVASVEKPSLLWFFRKPMNVNYLTRKEVLQMLNKLKLIQYKESNYFYIVNVIFDTILRKLSYDTKLKIYNLCNFLCKKIGIPPTVSSYIFVK